jgi:hypothetical protein
MAIAQWLAKLPAHRRLIRSATPAETGTRMSNKAPTNRTTDLCEPTGDPPSHIPGPSRAVPNNYKSVPQSWKALPESKFRQVIAHVEAVLFEISTDGSSVNILERNVNPQTLNRWADHLRQALKTLTWEGRQP